MTKTKKAKPPAFGDADGFIFTTARASIGHRSQWNAVKEGSDVINNHMTTLPR